MRDLSTKENTLSLYEVDDPANIERIVVAFAAGRPDLDDIGFVVFHATPSELGIRVERTPGRTPDVAIDPLHRNLEELTAARLAILAAAMFPGSRDERTKKELKGLMNAGLVGGALDQTKMNAKLLNQLR